MALINTATALKVGGSTVAKVYAGSVQVWPTGDPGPAGYADEVLADSPLVYYRLGADLNDSSGNARHGTASAAPTPTTGLLTGDADGAMSFNGSTQGVQCSVNDAPLNAAAFTVEAIIRPSTVAGGRYIASRQNNANNQDSWVFQTNETALSFTAWRTQSAAQALTSSAGVLAASTTYHVAAVHGGSSGRLKLYVNGAEVADAAALAGPYYGGPAPIRVARWASGGFFAGVLDEFAFYGTALSPTRIADHYAAATA